MRKFLISFVLFLICKVLWSQELHTNLFFQYHGVNENQIELEYISIVLQNNNLTPTSSQYERVIMEAHDYYINHKEEIDIAYKANELLEYRSARKAYVAAAWGQALTTIAAGIPSAIAAGQQQQKEYQEKLNRDRKIQDYITQNSSRTPMVTPQQNFGNSLSVNNSHETRHVTTSNGYDTPLPSSPSYKSVSDTSKKIASSLSEKVIQAVYVQGNQLVSCKLRFMNGQIWAYSTSKDALNHEEWNNIYPQSPTPTMSLKDGDNARNYKYTVSSAGMIFYFNM